MNKVIVDTRLSADLSEAAQFNSGGFELIHEPLFTVKKIKLDQSKVNLDNLQAVIFTSANASDAIIDLRLKKELPIFAIGSVSANKLIAAGYNNLFYSPQKNASSLKELILKKLDPNSGKIIYFCGEVVTIDFKVELEDSGFEVDKILAYQLTAVKNFSNQFIGKLLNNQITEILLYSENSAEVFFTLFKKAIKAHFLQESDLRKIKISCFSDKILLKVKNLKKDLSLNPLQAQKFN